MKSTAWNLPEEEPDDPSMPGRPLPVLISLHFLRAAIRRRWRTAVLSAALGLIGGMAFLVLVPPSHTATATLLLAHDPQSDPTLAMTTDVTLLTTHSVAEQTIAQLNLRVTPDDLVKSLTPVASSSQVLTLTLQAPTSQEAVRRLATLTDVYLKFRATQVTAQSTYLINGLNTRITALQGQVAQITGRLDQLSKLGAAGASAVNDAISERSQLSSQIGSLEQQVQDDALQANAIVSASRVIDPAAAPAAGGKLKQLVLVLGSGLIGGTAVGLSLILFTAITSDRLRRRFEVATALEAPVLVSVRTLAPLPRGLRRLPVLRGYEARRAMERRQVAHTLTRAAGGRGRWLTVACLDNAHEVAFATATAAMVLREKGTGALLVDLTEEGRLEAAVWTLLRGQSVDPPIVLRPRDLPSTAEGFQDLYRMDPWRRTLHARHASAEAAAAAAAAAGEPRPGSTGPAAAAGQARVAPAAVAGRGSGQEQPPERRPEQGPEQGPETERVASTPPDTAALSLSSDTCLVLADLDPSIGAEHLRNFSSRVVVAVTGGRSSAERVRTAGELVRAAGLTLVGSLLLRADITDDSSGQVRPTVAAPVAERMP